MPPTSTCSTVRAEPARDDRLETFGEWQATIQALWHEASFREERYAALALVGYGAYAPFHTLAALPLYAQLIVDGAWWDLVDGLATSSGFFVSKAIGWALREYAKAEPDAVRAYVAAHEAQLSGLSRHPALKHL